MTQPSRTETTDNAAFDRWMSAVDAECIDRTGLSIHDLADQPFRDWYNDELTPHSAEDEALSNEGIA